MERAVDVRTSRECRQELDSLQTHVFGRVIVVTGRDGHDELQHAVLDPRLLAARVTDDVGLEGAEGGDQLGRGAGAQGRQVRRGLYARHGAADRRRGGTVARGGRAAVGARLFDWSSGPRLAKCRQLDAWATAWRLVKAAGAGRRRLSASLSVRGKSYVP